MNRRPNQELALAARTPAVRQATATRCPRLAVWATVGRIFYYPSMAAWVDWSAAKRRVLEQSQAGFEPSHKTNQVYLDLVIAGQTEQPMRLAFQLFEQNPLSFANFHAMCAQSHVGLGEAGKLLRYKGTDIYRISKGICLEGGDITLGDGTGGDSIYGAHGFEPEPFGLSLAHDAAGLLSYVPKDGTGFSQSRFRISLGPTPFHDGRAVIIGRMVSGMMHLSTLEGMAVDAADRPARRVSVVESGLIPGWSSIPAPLPSAGPPATATLGMVDESANALRDSVASAVKAALVEQGAGSKKRPAEGGGAASSAPAAKRAGGAGAGMMALPSFEGDLSSDDEDEDADEQAEKDKS